MGVREESPGEMLLGPDCLQVGRKKRDRSQNCRVTMTAGGVQVSGPECSLRMSREPQPLLGEQPDYSCPLGKLAESK